MTAINCLRDGVIPPKKFAKFGKLPGQPSKLIRLALTDLRVVERRRKTFEVDMGVFIGSSEGVCQVCFGGAALAGTVRFNVGVLRRHADEDLSLPQTFGDAAKAALALDLFRTGQLACAFEHLNLVFPTYLVQEAVDVIDYVEDRFLFKKQMTQLADQLESIGY